MQIYEIILILTYFSPKIFFTRLWGQAPSVEVEFTDDEIAQMKQLISSSNSWWFEGEICAISTLYCIKKYIFCAIGLRN